MSAPTSAPDGTGTYVLPAEGRHNRVHAVIEAVVLAQPKGRPIGRTSDRRARTVLPQEAGVREVRPYDDRHTAGTLLLSEGVRPRVVMELLGHSQMRTTMDIYSHVMPALAREAADRVSALPP